MVFVRYCYRITDLLAISVLILLILIQPTAGREQNQRTPRTSVFTITSQFNSILTRFSSS